MHKFKQPHELKIQTTEIAEELLPIERIVRRWIDEEFQSKWGRLFNLADENERRQIVEAHAFSVEQEVEAQTGEDVLTQVVAIDEPDGFRVMVQLARYAEHMPILIDAVYSEESGILVDTDGDGL